MPKRNRLGYAEFTYPLFSERIQRTMSLDSDAVLAALDGPRGLVQADGGDMELTSVEGATAKIRLIIDGAECAECVMPRQFLEQITLDMVRAELPGVEAVEIDDPREHPA